MTTCDDAFTRRAKRLNKRVHKPVDRLIVEQSRLFELSLLESQRIKEEQNLRQQRAIRLQEKIKQNSDKRESELASKRKKVEEEKEITYKKTSEKNNKILSVKKTKLVSLPKPRKSKASSSPFIAREVPVKRPEALSSFFGSKTTPKNIEARTEIDLTSYSYGTEVTSDMNQLDLVFCLDCTGSMGSEIQSCKTSIVSLANTIITSEGQDVRLSLIPYRDHQIGEDYCTKVYPFTRDSNQMQSNVNAQSPGGGHDGPEAVTAAMFEALCLDWRPKAAKVVIFMADAPPHGIQRGNDDYPDGDPDGKDPLIIAREMIGLGISIYSLISRGSNDTNDFFAAISAMTGGQCLSLKDASLVADFILSGVKENIDIESKMKVVYEKVQEAACDKGERLTTDETNAITQRVLGADAVAAREIDAEKLITISATKLDAAKAARNITELRTAWSGHAGAPVGGPVSVAAEAITLRIGRMVEARSSRSAAKVTVECVEEGGKVRARVVSDGFDPTKNCQFPRDMRSVGKRFLVETVVDAGSFYRVKGTIEEI